MNSYSSRILIFLTYNQRIASKMKKSKYLHKRIRDLSKVAQGQKKILRVKQGMRGITICKRVT